MSYSRLVMYSFGFQKLFAEHKDPRDSVFFTKCCSSAKEVIRIMNEELAHSGYMKYAPDGYFVFAAFASAFLLKILRPRQQFAPMLGKSEETNVVELIGRLIQTFSSPDIAADEKHTPKLYARFLTGLLTRQRSDGPTTGQLQTHPPPSSSMSPDQRHHHPSGPGSFYSQGGFASSMHAPGAGGSFGGAGGGSVGGSQLGQPMQGGTPVYRPEASFVVGGANPLDLGGADFLGGMDGISGGEDGMEYDTRLTSMKALSDPSWWQTMMMPG